MNTKEIIKAIQYIKPNAEFSFKDDDYSTIKWDILEGDAPTWEEILDADAEIKAQNEQALVKKEALLERLGITTEEAKLLVS